MKTWIEDQIPTNDQELLRLARDLVDGLHNPYNRWLSCHEVAQYVFDRLHGQFPGIKVVRGYLKPNFEHSWIETSAENVLDVYPVGQLGGPVLIWKQVACWHFEPESEPEPVRLDASERFRVLEPGEQPQPGDVHRRLQSDACVVTRPVAPIPLGSMLNQAHDVLVDKSMATWRP